MANYSLNVVPIPHFLQKIWFQNPSKKGNKVFYIITVKIYGSGIRTTI
jgi:hypothetical protein